MDFSWFKKRRKHLNTRVNRDKRERKEKLERETREIKKRRRGVTKILIGYISKLT
jgi:hypothetical protein